MAAAAAAPVHTPWIPTPSDRSHYRFLHAWHLLLFCGYFDLVIHSGSYVWTDRFALATVDVLSVVVSLTGPSHSRLRLRIQAYLRRLYSAPAIEPRSSGLILVKRTFIQLGS
jgi:hypothetical protein